VLRFIQILLLAALASVSLASYSSVDQGHAWLAAHQQVDGSVLRDPGLAHSLQSTAETVLAFDAADSATGLNRNQALDYLNSNSDLSTEFIARALLLGIQTDSNGGSLLERLKSHQSIDGGFGSYEDFHGNVLDTALALSAMAQVKDEISHAIAIGNAINFLINNQSTSGAFTLSPSETPSIPLTALVSISLQNYIFDFPIVSGSVSTISQYLLSNQVLGSGLENNWQTAVSLLAVIPVVRDSALYASSVEQLTVDQEADGSWGGSVFATALALRALGLAANITFPEDPTTGIFSGQIFANDTGTPLLNVSISLVEDSGLTAASDALGRFSLEGVAPGVYTINYQVPGFSSASQSATAVVGQVTSLGEIKLQRLPNTGIITGNITDAISGLALPTASIVFTSSDATVSAPVQSDGDYQVALAPESYSFVVAAAGYQLISGTATVNAGNNLVFSPALYPDNETPTETAVTLLGLVVDAENGAPIAGANIQILGASLQAITGSTGGFSLEDLGVGEIVFTVSVQDYIPQQLQMIAPTVGQFNVGTIALVSDNTEEPLTSKIFGTIVDSETGEPIEGASVLLEQTGASTASLSNGSYTLADIETLTFSLFISAPGYWSEWSAFSFSEHGNVQYNVSLTPSDLGGFAIDQLVTDQQIYNAYNPVAISANLVNAGDVPASARLFLEIFDASGVLITSLPVNTTTGGVGPGDAITVLPGELAAIEAQWYTGVVEPGSYTVKLTAFDEFTNQLLSEDVSYIDVVETINISSLMLRTNTEFSSVGLTESLALTLETVNRSNVPVTFMFKTQWNDPNGLEIRLTETEISLSPEEFSKVIVLDEYLHTFELDGDYPLSGQLINSEITTVVQGLSISVAPTVRVQATQSVTPDSVVPDGDKRITIGIQVEGVER